MASDEVEGIVGIWQKLLLNPLNATLFMICAYLLYKICLSKSHLADLHPSSEPELPKMKKHDITIDELKEYNGIKHEGRILIAVNGKVFDVTEGKKKYGPEGPYGIFAGRDASRGLAQFCLDKDVIKDGYDDISDLNALEKDSVKEWEMQFSEKYHFVGKLLKPGEEPTDYSDISESEAEKEKNKDD